MASLDSFDISPSVICKLLEADFHLASDIINLQPSELSAATKLSLAQSAEVIRIVSPKSESVLSQAKSVIDLIEAEDGISHIVTFCESLDEMLGGGIPLKAITEVSGLPGVGKTQMCLQVCLSVQIPESVGGLYGEAIYIDTEGTFSASRLREMADYTAKHLNSLGENYNIETLLNNVYFFRCHSHLELLVIVKHLFTFLKEHPKVRIVVIDSIVFPFKYSFTDLRVRTSLLCSLAQDLNRLASEHNLAVLLTNQMTTKFDFYGSSNSQIVAALGETWGYCLSIRLLLHWEKDLRVVSVVKAPHIAHEQQTYFKITPGGFRGYRSGETCKKRKLC